MCPATGTHLISTPFPCQHLAKKIFTKHSGVGEKRTPMAITWGRAPRKASHRRATQLRAAMGPCLWWRRPCVSPCLLPHPGGTGPKRETDRRARRRDFAERTTDSGRVGVGSRAASRPASLPARHRTCCFSPVEDRTFDPSRRCSGDARACWITDVMLPWGERGPSGLMRARKACPMSIAAAPGALFAMFTTRIMGKAARVAASAGC